MTTPTLIELPELEQGTEAWHDQRRGIVTASVVGQLISIGSLTAIDYDCPDCGAPASDPCRSKVKAGAVIKTLHPERTAAAAAGRSTVVLEVAKGDTARSLTMFLAAERRTNYTEPTFISDDMMRGNEDEPRARDLYSEIYAPVTELGFMIREDNGVRIGYSPDGLVGDDGLIEIKSRRQKKQFKTVVENVPPAENMAQMQCGLLVSGRQWCDYVSYSGGMEMWKTRVYPDQQWFDAILAAVNTFEENVAKYLATYEKHIVGFPMTERTVIDLTPEVELDI